MKNILGSLFFVCFYILTKYSEIKIIKTELFENICGGRRVNDMLCVLLKKIQCCLT